MHRDVPTQRTYSCRDDSGGIPIVIIPVLEVGGTHVSAATVAWDGAARVVTQVRRQLDATGSATEIIRTLVSAGSELGVVGGRWAVAIPGPFDYAAGIGLYENVGKFENLRNVDVKTPLRSGLRATSLHLVNDAEAYGLGEVVAGAAQGHARAVCITLGTGVGSAFIADGSPVNSGVDVPPQGNIHLVESDGRPLEERVSRRAIRAAYSARTGHNLDVYGIAERARMGEPEAIAVIATAMELLGAAVAPWVTSFGASIVVVGGSISRSWDLIASPFRLGLDRGRATGAVAVVPSVLLDDAPLIGAASVLFS